MGRSEQKKIHDRDLGRIEMRNIPLLDYMEGFFGTYTNSGKVLVAYRIAEDVGEKDWRNVAAVNDDGIGLSLICSGVIPREIADARGIFAFGRR